MNCINVDLTLDVFQLQLYLFNGVLVYVPTVYFIMVGSIVRLFAHYSHMYIHHSPFPVPLLSCIYWLSINGDWLTIWLCLSWLYDWRYGWTDRLWNHWETASDNVFKQRQFLVYPLLPLTHKLTHWLAPVFIVYSHFHLHIRNPYDLHYTMRMKHT